MAFPISNVVKYAPIVNFHPDEEYFPIDPMDFISKSRFRHHRVGKDEGYDKTKDKWVKTNSQETNYYDIPVDFIDKFRVWGRRNRRPHDSASGDHWNVFLQTRKKEKGVPDPDSKIPVFYYVKRTDTTEFAETARKQFNIQPEINYKIQYWWFFGYNNGPATQNHQGDWEHVTVRLDEDANIQGVYFAAHGKPKFVKKNELKFSNDHCNVYIAKGTHAAYEKAGDFPLKVLGIKVADDNTRDNGNVWNTELKLLSLRTQPWRYYAGAWGEVGELADTTGPLGPWHKKDKN